jgi:ribosomal protein S18 acetylase RimI-like enzyme
MSPKVRELTAPDAPALRDFFTSMPAEDRTFFFQDVNDPAVAEGWAGDERRLRRAAIDADGRIVAFAALQPGVDWSSHVAEMVLVVAPEARRAGLGRTLARGMLLEAVEQGFKKVTVMIPADNEGAIQMFSKIGFQPEALLRDQLRSPEDGTLRDVVIVAHLVDETWSTMLTAGFEEATA